MPETKAPLCLALSLLALIGVANSQADGRVARVGNSVEPSSSGVDSDGVTFLLNDAVLEEGVLFAFSAFFRYNTKVRFQVWRPKTNRVFELIEELPVTSTAGFQREDIYLESKFADCIYVQFQDKVGVYLEESPGAISYIFDKNTPTTFAHTLENKTLPNIIGDEVIFDPLTFPYDFSLAAYVDTNLTGLSENVTNPPCPKGLLIPEYGEITLPPATTVPITGAPGATGPRGPIGPQGPQGVDGAPGVTGAQGEAGPEGMTGEPGPEGPQGVTGAMGLSGSTGEQGPPGADGSDGAPGAQGPPGIPYNESLVGAPGPQGPPGPAGRPGSSGNNATVPVAPVASSTEERLFGNPWLVLVTFIWLALLTLIVVVFICIVASFYKRRKAKKRENVPHTAQHPNSIYVDPGTFDSFDQPKDVDATAPPKERILSATSEADPEWMAGMKEQEERNFSHDTIERDGNNGYSTLGETLAKE